MCVAALCWSAACGSAPAVPPATPPAADGYPAPTGGLAQGYPEPGNAGAQSGYPAQDPYFVQPTDVVNPVAPSDAPQPAPGLATVSGILFSYTTARILPDTSFYLAPANGPNERGVPELLASPDKAKGHVIGTSDSQGRVTLVDIPPGKYYLLVWAPLNWIFAEISPQDTRPRQIELAPDQALPLGVLYLSWP